MTVAVIAWATGSVGWHYSDRRKDRLSGHRLPVMPAQAGIDDFARLQQRKSWMAALRPP